MVWKEALVVLVFKGGCKSSPSNYRPIALLSIVNKVMEKIVFKRLNAFIDPLLSATVWLPQEGQHQPPAPPSGTRMVISP